MTPQQESICSLVDGGLTEDQAAGLAASISATPGLMANLHGELVLSDMMSRALDPSRSKAAFLTSLDAALNSIGGQGSDPNSDPDSPDMDGPRHDPGASGGSGSGMTTGILKGAVGTIIALTAAAGIYHAVTTKPVEPEAAPVAEPVTLDIIAEADTCYSAMFSYRAAGRFTMLNVDGNLKAKGKNTSAGAVIRFDLNGVPDHATRVDLRLYGIAFAPGSLPDKISSLAKADIPLDIYLVDEDDWDEMAAGKDIPLGAGPPLATFSATPGAYTDIDLTNVVLTETKKDGKLTLRIEVAKQYKKRAVQALVSREHIDPHGDRHAPSLRVTYLPNE